MKKITLILLALVCALCCAFGLVACGGNAISAERWAECFSSLDSADNLTLNVIASMGGSVLKLDGAKCSVKNFGEEEIFVKDGENYYHYHYRTNGLGGEWTRENIFEQDYNTNVESYKASIPKYSSLKDDFNSFTYKNDNGKSFYVCESLDKTATIGDVIKNVEVTFENNKLKSVDFRDKQFGRKFALSDIGNTVITLPTDYTEISD